MTTDLYQRTIAFDHGDAERNDIMLKVWQPTPWMVDLFEGPHDNGRSRDMRVWCRERFGDECWPLHGKTGTWQRGCATIHGWTWWGFATEAQLTEFCAKWQR